MLLVNKCSHYEKQNGVSFLKMLKIELPFDPVYIYIYIYISPLLGIHLEKKGKL